MRNVQMFGMAAILAASTACVEPLQDPAKGCEGLCGDGPLQAVDTLTLVDAAEDGSSPGFNLDGVDGSSRPDCTADDRLAPDGTPGIDNRLADILPVIRGFAGEALPTLIQNSINAGGLGIVMERVQREGKTHLVFHRTEGLPLLGADDRLLPDQTYALAGETLGTCLDATVNGNVTECGRFEMKVYITVFQFTYSMTLRNTLLRLTDDPVTGLTTILMGGGVSVQDLMGIADLINVGDLQEAVRELLPPFADMPSGPDGECEWISGSVQLTAKSAFVLADAP